MPEATKTHYKLNGMVAGDGYAYARVREAWCGLRQAGGVAHGGLVGRLGAHGYMAN